MGIYIAIAGVTFLAWSNRDQIKSFLARKQAVLSVPSRTSPDIHDAVDAVRALQAYFAADPETAGTIAKASGLKLFHVEGGEGSDVKPSN